MDELKESVFETWIQGTLWIKFSTSNSRLLPEFPVREPFFDDKCFDKLKEHNFLY